MNFICNNKNNGSLSCFAQVAITKYYRPGDLNTVLEAKSKIKVPGNSILCLPSLQTTFSLCLPMVEKESSGLFLF